VDRDREHRQEEVAGDLTERHCDLSIPPKCAFLFDPHRYKVLYGGRGAAKSHSIAKVLLVQGMLERLRILCTREFQLSITDSVHKLLRDQIELLGLGDFYDIQKTRILGANGTEFIYAGLRQGVESIRSLEGVTRCWVEEAQRVSEASWKILIPTIRADGSEIWVSFNRHKTTDPTDQRFIDHPPPGAEVVKIGWEDNDWFPDELRKEKDYDYRVDPDAAAHVWGGEPLKYTKAQILFGKVAVEPFEPAADWSGPYQGIDWGFSVSPTALVRVWVQTAKPTSEGADPARTLYVEHEAFGVGVDLDATPALFDRVPRAREYTSRADCSRPETISHMQKHGYPEIGPCKKGPGSVEDGIVHLRSYERIVIHPRCVHAEEQARLWQWKVDKLTGDILPEQVDRHNDIWDAARYALEPIIRGNDDEIVVC
jgi:phage terminase large subunit